MAKPEFDPNGHVHTKFGKLDIEAFRRVILLLEEGAYYERGEPSGAELEALSDSLKALVAARARVSQAADEPEAAKTASAAGDNGEDI